MQEAAHARAVPIFWRAGQFNFLAAGFIVSPQAFVAGDALPPTIRNILRLVARHSFGTRIASTYAALRSSKMTKDQMMRFRGALQAKRQELVSAIRAHTGGFATLARRGCHARSTASGKDALEMLRRYSFDLIILDAHLPDMQGAEIAMAVRSGVFTTGATIRVISSDDGSDNVLLLRNAEVDEFIAKPVAANKLRDRLEHWLHSSSRGVNPNGTSRGGECG